MLAKSEICAGIVLYNPDAELLRENIASIINQVECLVIYNNGSLNISDIRTDLFGDKRITVLGNGDNKGIAYALNRLCMWAMEHGFQWIITLDQDSVSSEGLVNALSSYTDQEIAIVAPNIVYQDKELFSEHPNEKYQEVRWVITSASLMNLEIWKKLNGFDEWLFIDGVDYDYCIRANRAGYKVIRTCDAKLLHRLGDTKYRSLFGKKIIVTNHSANRKYYMTRNTIYLYGKLHEGKPTKKVVKYILKTVLFEDHKLQKLSSIVKGIFDGLKSMRRK